MPRAGKLCALTTVIWLCTGSRAAESSPHRVLPPLAKYYYGCLTGNHTYRLVTSHSELRAFARELSEKCDVEERAYLTAAAAAKLDFDREVLVLVEQFYGGTGMARASLELSGPVDGVVTASIVITVPPPPHTPDVARFPFAFAVSRLGTERIDIKVGNAVVRSLSLK